MLASMKAERRSAWASICVVDSSGSFSRGSHWRNAKTAPIMRAIARRIRRSFFMSSFYFFFFNLSNSLWKKRTALRHSFAFWLSGSIWRVFLKS